MIISLTMTPYIKTPPVDTGGFSIITISRTGAAAAANVDLAFVLSDNDTLVTVIDGRKEIVTLTARFSSPLLEVIPDPFFKLPLINRQSRKVSDTL